MRVDLSNVQSGFEPVPAGPYLVAISEGELKEAGENAKNPGSEYINWTLTIQQGDYEGRKVFHNTSLLPNALFGLKGLLKATGKWSEEELASAEFDFNIDDVIGSVVVAIVGQQPYQGEMTNNVKRFKSAADMPSSEGSGLLP